MMCGNGTRSLKLYTNYRCQNVVDRGVGAVRLGDVGQECCPERAGARAAIPLATSHLYQSLSLQKHYNGGRAGRLFLNPGPPE